MNLRSLCAAGAAGLMIAIGAGTSPVGAATPEPLAPGAGEPGVPTLEAPAAPAETVGSDALVRTRDGGLKVTSSPTETPQELGERLSGDQVQVLTTDANVPRYALALPGADEQGRDLQWALSRLQAEDVWSRTTGYNVTVAVLDTGVKGNHADLKGHVLEGYDAIDRKPGARTDNNGHGTFIAGLIAGKRDGRGVVGLAPDARILPVKVLDAEGVGDSGDIAAGIIWAADNGAQVINMSFGADSPNAVEAEAIDYARSKGAVLVGAGGNTGWHDPTYPAAYPGVIGVGATDVNDHHSEFSDRGPHIDVVAPGEGILSAYGKGQKYLWTSGTSMSTAYVSALAALAIRFSPGAGGDPLADQIVLSARDIGQPGPDGDFGNGIIDPASLIEQMGGGRAPGMPRDLFVTGDPAARLIHVTFTPPAGTQVIVRYRRGKQAPANPGEGNLAYDGPSTGAPTVIDIPNQAVGKRYALSVFTSGPSGLSRAVAKLRPLKWELTKTGTVARKSRPQLTAGAKVKGFGWLGGFSLHADTQNGGGKKSSRKFIPTGFGPNRFQLRPLQWSFHYQFTFETPGFWNATTGPLSQYVSTEVSVESKSRIVGRVTPNKAASEVQLQRRDGKAWKTIDTTTTSRSGKFSFPKAAGDLRVHVPADLWHGPATATL